MTDCPPSPTLEQLLTGELAEPRAGAVRAHVSGCSHCQELLDRLSDDAELRGWLLKASSLGTQPPLDAALVRLMDGLSTPAGPDDCMTPVAARAVSSFLGPPDQDGDLGSLGPYAVQGELGRGGMGIVLRAWDPALRRRVAVKMLRPELANERTRTRFVREAQAAAHINHDHVVRVYAVANPPDSLPYFAMEYLGPTFAELIRAQQTLEPRAAATLIAQVAHGLAAAHAAGLIHRDIKPTNILLEPSTGRAKITDFGLARLETQASGMTQEGTLAGTPTYMSPEQAQGLSRVDGRSDVYSLGATLYEALTGQPPFRGAPHMILQQVVGEEPQSPRQLNDRIPYDLETICLKCLQKEPAQRYAGALEVAQDLQRFLAGEPVQARPVGILGRFGRWCRRKPLVAGLATGLVAVFCIGFAGVTWEWRQAVKSSLRAEQNWQSLREAVDKYYTQVSESQLLQEPGLQPLRRELLGAARDYYARFVQEQDKAPGLRADLAGALFRLANITRDIDSPQKARELFEQALALQEQLVHQSPGVDAYQFALAQTLNNLGNVCQDLTTNEAAQQRSLTILQDLAGRGADRDACRRGMYRAHNNLAHLYAAAWQLDKAETAYLAALAAAQKLADDHPGVSDYQTDLIASHIPLGLLYQMTGQLKKAETHYQAALDMDRRLVDTHPGVASFQYGLGMSYLNLGVVHLVDQQTISREAAAPLRAQARSDCEQSVTYLRQVAQNGPSITSYQHALALALNNRAAICQLNGQWEEAETAFKESLALFERLPPDYVPIARLQGNRDYTRLAYAVFLRDSGRHKEALDWFDRSIPAVEALWRRDERNIQARTLLCYALAARAIAFTMEDRYADALADSERALVLEPGTYHHLFKFQNTLLRARVSGSQGTQCFRALYRQAVAEAEGLLGKGVVPPGSFLSLAAMYSRAAAVAVEDEEVVPAERTARAERYAARAVLMLTKAQQAGFFLPAGRTERLRNEPVFQPLRGRPDFQKLLAEVQRAAAADGE
ncbi:MAG TPA: serine/threonine-protein kinase [Gemmataceae bacterium]|nr:serine/threonine-protein kinase [Gemmataceae bacterium]